MQTYPLRSNILGGEYPTVKWGATLKVAPLEKVAWSINISLGLLCVTVANTPVGCIINILRS